ncbi:hypothetical protein T12_2005 [Trichinella patagoniensis]|uniref:Uncharacterized protein n=1 Tax=Trichinella patagoniensis TaxID=990121 RepID=A0A0V1AES3_9BILA|nr:hypothetical protein T12_2005 [Trichinella patagoniensis]
MSSNEIVRIVGFDDERGSSLMNQSTQPYESRTQRRNKNKTRTTTYNSQIVQVDPISPLTPPTFS